MVTPLKSRSELDARGLEKLIEHLVPAGIAGLFVLGTTGEAPSLEYRLRYELVERSCEFVNGRVPVLVGVTDSAPQESVELANFARDCGASGIVAAPPYYFPIAAEDLSRYFLQLADESPLPLFLYNMPACVKVSIGMETAEQCAKHPNILGIKDSGGSLENFRRYLSLRELREDWTFLVGPEHLTTAAVLAGGHGGVNGGANLLPKLFVEACHAAENGELQLVARLQQEIESLGELYTVGDDFVSVARGLKAALELQGICSSVMAPPFQQYTRRKSKKSAVCSHAGNGPRWNGLRHSRGLRATHRDQRELF